MSYAARVMRGLVIDHVRSRRARKRGGEFEFTSLESEAAAPEKLRRQLRGDFETIVGKALKKNPQERYISVTAMADDLRRYLTHEPSVRRHVHLMQTTGARLVSPQTSRLRGPCLICDSKRSPSMAMAELPLSTPEPLDDREISSAADYQQET